MSFGESLKKARKAKKLSQKELGELLDLGQTTVANYEKDLRFPNKDILIKLTTVLGISADTLIGENDVDQIAPFTESELQHIYTLTESFLLNDETAHLKEFILNLNLDKNRRIQLFESVLRPILIHVGELWKEGVISVAKEHYISEIVTQVISSLAFKSHNNSTTSSNKEAGKSLAICLTMPSESHAIGLRIVADYFNALGIEALFLGSNVPTDALIDMIFQKEPKIIAISITLDHHIDSLKNMIEVIKNTITNQKNKYTKKITKMPLIIVGGQAIQVEAQVKAIGADIYASNFEQLKHALEERNII